MQTLLALTVGMCELCDDRAWNESSNSSRTVETDEQIRREKKMRGKSRGKEKERGRLIREENEKEEAGQRAMEMGVSIIFGMASGDA